MKTPLVTCAPHGHVRHIKAASGRPLCDVGLYPEHPHRRLTELGVGEPNCARCERRRLIEARV